jgi:hypothetical protein
MIITGAMFIMQWMTILPLYTDRSVQSTIQATMKEVAAKEGWLLSGIEIRSISKNEIEILFSEYGTSKNTSAKRCFIDRHSHTLSCEK